MANQVMKSDNVAVVTGAASGIGFAASKRFAEMGMRVYMTDIDESALERAALNLSGLDIMTAAADVGRRVDVENLLRDVVNRYGRVDVLFNNAVTRVGGGVRETYDGWRQAVDVNVWGVVHGVQVFLSQMLAQETPGYIINAGSKQGITNPPGNAAYNMCKAAVKSFTESLQHELRNIGGCQISAHLLIPGWTTTGEREHQPGAWLPDQVVDRMLESLDRGDFYILCPDNEVSPQMDRDRILWGAQDITENRPPLSRWHPDYQGAFSEFRS